MRLKLISCEIFFRELCACAARSPHIIDFDFLPKGLHDIGCEDMRARLQSAIDRVEERQYDALLMGYGLCRNGLAGLTARAVPVVVPRAHDCITLFLGGRQRHLEYVRRNPGVSFSTSGWIERGERLGKASQPGLTHQEMVARYGDENARFLEEETGNYKQQYRQYTFIQMGVEPDDRFEQRARERALERGWKFEKVCGDMSLIEGLVNGPWDDQRYLVVEPGWRVVARYDEGIIAAEKA